MNEADLSTPAPTPVRLVIDTDPGIDDVVTLALAARSPELVVEAVTTTYGNTTLAAATRNARTVLQLAGRPDVPIVPGSDRPLKRQLVTAPETHGETGVGYADVPPPHQDDGMPNHRALLDVLAVTSRPVTLVTIGPLTNLALAVGADRDLVLARVDRHLGMFGNLHERGTASRWADFNAWCDPEATDLVLRSGLNTTMVGLDVTRRMVLTSAEVERLAYSPDPLARWLGAALRYYVEFHRRAERAEGCVVNDVLTTGELISPGLLTCSRCRLSTNLGSDEQRGRTVKHPDGVETTVATSVDVTHMRQLLSRVLGEYCTDALNSGGTR